MRPWGFPAIYVYPTWTHYIAPSKLWWYFSTCNFQSCFIDWHLKHYLHNIHQVNAPGPHLLISPWIKWQHFTDNIFRSIFMNEKFCILTQISLKFVLKGPIDNNPELVPNRQQTIIWTNADPIHWHINAALGGDELIIDQHWFRWYLDAVSHQAITWGNINQILW